MVINRISIGLNGMQLGDQFADSLENFLKAQYVESKSDFDSKKKIKQSVY